MLNIRAFITALKVSWLRKLTCESEFKEATLNMYPALTNIDKLGSEYASVAVARIKNLFWKDVLRHYQRVSSKCFVSNMNEFMSERIHYNINILRDRKIVYVQEWCDAGIFSIRQLVNANRDFLTYDEFILKYPNILRTNFLMYNGILNSIKQYKNNLNIIPDGSHRELDSKVWYVLKKGNKFIQSLVLKSDATPTATQRWNRQFVGLDWVKIFSHCCKTTLDVQLRWFQMKLLHRLIPTEKYLYQCKIIESPLCGFCNTENQTIEHLFWHCERVRVFWNDVLALVNDKCQHVHNLNFNHNLILFGIAQNIKTDRGLDLLILWAKYFIYKCKIQKKIPNLQGFHIFLKSRWNLEKYASSINGTQGLFDRTWTPYLALLQ